MLRFRRVGAVFVAGVYLLTNVMAAHAIERSLWEERRAALHQASLDARLVSVLQSPKRWGPTLFDGGSTTSQPPSNYLNRAVPFDVASAALPYGAIGEVHQGRPGAPVVFLVQDVHGNLGAQKNIGGLLGALSARGVALAGVEGAWGPLDLTAYHRHPSPKAVSLVADALLASGRLSGSEWAGLTAPSPPTLVGVESQNLYHANVTAARECVARRPAVASFLRSLDQVLQAQKERRYSPELKLFDRRQKDYHAGREGLADFSHYLSGLPGAEDRAGAQVKMFLKALEWESRLNFDRIEAERRRLMDRLAQNLDPKGLEGLLAEAMSYRAGTQTNGDFFSYLTSLCAKTKISFTAYQSFADYMAYVRLVQSIRRIDLLKELALWETAMGDSLARTPQERGLLILDRDAELLRRLLENGMSPDDWTLFNERRQEIVTLPNRFRLFGNIHEPPEGLAALFRPHDEFCRLAMERNGALVTNFLRQVESRKAIQAVLLTGGFHTPGLQSELKKRGCSTVVITPRIEKVEGKPLDVFARDPLPFDQLFAGKPISLSPELFFISRDRNDVFTGICAVVAMRLSTKMTNALKLWLKKRGTKIKRSSWNPRVASLTLPFKNFVGVFRAGRLESDQMEKLEGGTARFQTELQNGDQVISIVKRVRHRRIKQGIKSMGLKVFFIGLMEFLEFIEKILGLEILRVPRVLQMVPPSPRSSVKAENVSSSLDRKLRKMFSQFEAEEKAQGRSVEVLVLGEFLEPRKTSPLKTLDLIVLSKESGEKSFPVRFVNFLNQESERVGVTEAKLINSDSGPSHIGISFMMGKVQVKLGGVAGPDAFEDQLKAYMNIRDLGPEEKARRYLIASNFLGKEEEEYELAGLVETLSLTNGDEKKLDLIKRVGIVLHDFSQITSREKSEFKVRARRWPDDNIRRRPQRGPPEKVALAELVSMALDLPIHLTSEQFNERLIEKGLDPHESDGFTFTNTGKLNLTIGENRRLFFAEGLSQLPEGAITVRWSWHVGIGLIIYITREGEEETLAFSIEQARQTFLTPDEKFKNGDLVGRYPNMDEAKKEACRMVQLCRLISGTAGVDPLLAESSREVQLAQKKVNEFAAGGPVAIGAEENEKLVLIDPGNNQSLSLKMGKTGAGTITPRWDEVAGLILEVRRGEDVAIFDFVNARSDTDVSRKRFSLVRVPSDPSSDLRRVRNRAIQTALARILGVVYRAGGEGFPPEAPHEFSQAMEVFQKNRIIYGMEKGNKVEINGVERKSLGPLTIIFPGLPPREELRVSGEWLYGRGPVFYFEVVGSGQTYTYGLGDIKWAQSQRNLNGTMIFSPQNVPPTLAHARRWVRRIPGGLITRAIVGGRDPHEEDLGDSIASPYPHGDFFPPPGHGIPYVLPDSVAGIRYQCDGVASGWKGVKLIILALTISMTFRSQKNEERTVNFHIPQSLEPQSKLPVMLNEKLAGTNTISFILLPLPFDPGIGLALAGILVLFVLYRDPIIRWMKSKNLFSRMREWIVDVFPDLSSFGSAWSGLTEPVFSGEESPMRNKLFKWLFPALAYSKSALGPEGPARGTGKGFEIKSEGDDGNQFNVSHNGVNIGSLLLKEVKGILFVSNIRWESKGISPRGMFIELGVMANLKGLRLEIQVTTNELLKTAIGVLDNPIVSKNTSVSQDETLPDFIGNQEPVRWKRLRLSPREPDVLPISVQSPYYVSGTLQDKLLSGSRVVTRDNFSISAFSVLRGHLEKLQGNLGVREIDFSGSLPGEGVASGGLEKGSFVIDLIVRIEKNHQEIWKQEFTDMLQKSNRYQEVTNLEIGDGSVFDFHIRLIDNQGRTIELMGVLGEDPFWVQLQRTVLSWRGKNISPEKIRWYQIGRYYWDDGDTEWSDASEIQRIEESLGNDEKIRLAKEFNRNYKKIEEPLSAFQIAKIHEKEERGASGSPDFVGSERAIDPPIEPDQGKLSEDSTEEQILDKADPPLLEGDSEQNGLLLARIISNSFDVDPNETSEVFFGKLNQLERSVMDNGLPLQIEPREFRLTINRYLTLSFESGFKDFNSNQLTVFCQWEKGIGLLLFFLDANGRTLVYSVANYPHTLEAKSETATLDNILLGWRHGRPRRNYVRPVFIGEARTLNDAKNRVVRLALISRIVIEYGFILPAYLNRSLKTELVRKIGELELRGSLDIPVPPSKYLSLIDPITGINFGLELKDWTGNEASLSLSHDKFSGLVLTFVHEHQTTIFDMQSQWESKPQSFRLSRPPQGPTVSIRANPHRNAYLAHFERVLENVFSTGETEAVRKGKLEDLRAYFEQEGGGIPSGAGEIKVFFRRNGKEEKSVCRFSGLPIGNLQIRFSEEPHRGFVIYFVGAEKTCAYSLQNAMDSSVKAKGLRVDGDSFEAVLEAVRSNPSGILLQALAAGEPRNSDLSPVPEVIRGVLTLLDPISGISWRFKGLTDQVVEGLRIESDPEGVTILATVSWAGSPSPIDVPYRIQRAQFQEHERVRTVEGRTKSRGAARPKSRDPNTQGLNGVFLLAIPFDQHIGFIAVVLCIVAMLFKDEILNWLRGWIPPRVCQFLCDETPVDPTPTVNFLKAGYPIDGITVERRPVNDTLSSADRQAFGDALTNLLSPSFQMQGVAALVDPHRLVSKERAVDRLKELLDFDGASSWEVPNGLLEGVIQNNSESVLRVRLFAAQVLGKKALASRIVTAVASGDGANAGAALAAWDDSKFLAGPSPEIVGEILAELTAGQANQSEAVTSAFSQAYNLARSGLLFPKLMGGQWIGHKAAQPNAPGIVLNLSPLFDASASTVLKDQTWLALASALTPLERDPNAPLALVVFGKGNNRKTVEEILSRGLPKVAADGLRSRLIVEDETSSTKFFEEGKFILSVLQKSPQWQRDVIALGFTEETLVKGAGYSIQWIPLDVPLNPDLLRIVNLLKFIRLNA